MTRALVKVVDQPPEPVDDRTRLIDYFRTLASIDPIGTDAALHQLRQSHDADHSVDVDIEN